jgi:hypothetical protein
VTTTSQQLDYVKTVQAACIAHEANRAVQILFADPAPSPAWDDAPSWQRESAIEGVYGARRGLTPAQQHDAWCEHKRNDGWTWGPTKDAELKTHPCLVSYTALPNDQKLKDKIFVAIVRAVFDE